MNNEYRFHFPYSLPIKEIIQEDMNTGTLSFELPSSPRMSINPGQYFMLWLPKDDEIPISVSLYEENTISFTICSVGPTSKNLLSQKEGNLIGLRGPFGNGFSPKITSNLLVVGGGMGMPPLRFLIHSFYSST